MGKLINRIPGLRLLISSLSGSAFRMHVESLGMSTSVLKALPGKLDIKKHSPSILCFIAFWISVQQETDKNTFIAILFFLLGTNNSPSIRISTHPHVPDQVAHLLILTGNLINDLHERIQRLNIM